MIPRRPRPARSFNGLREAATASWRISLRTIRNFGFAKRHRAPRLAAVSIGGCGAIEHQAVRLVLLEVQAVAPAAEMLVLVALHLVLEFPLHELHHPRILGLEPRDDQLVGRLNRF